MTIRQWYWERVYRWDVWHFALLAHLRLLSYESGVGLVCPECGGGKYKRDESGDRCGACHGTGKAGFGAWFRGWK